MTNVEPWNETQARVIIEAHAALDGALLPILHAMNDRFGYVPRDAIPLIAEMLNLSRAEVHGVATFYHDFRTEPAGRSVIKICRAEACQAMGCEPLVARAESRLGISCGETTPDGRISLQAVYCLGLCATAPAAMIEDRVVGRLTDEKLEHLLLESG
ncbi:MAG: formate dehydrogenase subunit gamma [Pseudomonadota bacterium]